MIVMMIVKVIVGAVAKAMRRKGKAAHTEYRMGIK